MRHVMQTTMRAVRACGIITILCATVVAALVIGVATRRVHASPRWLVITWGENTPEWNRKLDVSAIRQGCSDTPTSCINEIKSQKGKKIFLSILLKTAIPGNYGPQYGLLAREAPSLVSIGADDFVGQYQKLFLAGFQNAPAALTSLVDGIKSGNVGFGLTIYEDDLHSPYLSDQDFPPATRAKVDYVHLYIHYRADTPNTTRYVQEAKAIFPNAKVILGVYAYDRISYLPCTKGGQPCTAQQEQDYLRQGLDTDLQLVKSGDAAGIEFWPGSFGKIDEWKGWDEARICPGRRSECVKNTHEMRQIVAEEFKTHGI
jgi:hypothetical protein